MSVMADNPDAGIGERWRYFRKTKYCISSLGRVRSPRGAILKQKRQNNGYMRISLGIRHDELVHRMVLIAFRGEPPSPKHESDHRNKNRSDNTLENLRWLTKKKNLANRTIHKGINHHQVILSESDVKMILSGPFYRGRDRIIAELLGVSREEVRDIRLRKKWKHIPHQGEKV